MVASKEALGVKAGVFTVMKAMIGTGILALPFLAGKVGLAFALPTLFLIAVLNLLGTWRLAECMGILFPARPCDGDCGSSSEEESQGSSSEADGGVQQTPQEDDYGLGPIAIVGFHTLGAWSVVVAGVCGLLNQLGVSAAYFMIIVETLHIGLLPAWGIDATKQSVRVAICVVCCMLSLVRQMNTLAKMSLVALGVYVYVAISLAHWGSVRFADGLAPEQGLWLPTHWDHVAEYYGAAIFSFEGVFLAQHVYADMQLGANSRPFLKVLVIAYPMCFAAYAFVAVFGKLSFGSDTKHIIYENFPVGSIDVILIQAIIVVVLLVSFALQMFPIFVFLNSQFCGTNMHKTPAVTDTDSEKGETVLEENGAKIKGRKRKAIGDTLMRFTTVGLTCTIAVLVPNFEDLMGYIGCFALSTIGFILPALFHISACTKMGRAISLKGWLVNIVLIIAGGTAFLLGLMKLFTAVSKDAM